MLLSICASMSFRSRVRINFQGEAKTERGEGAYVAVCTLA